VTAEPEAGPGVDPLVMARDWAGRVHEIAVYFQNRGDMGRIEAVTQGAGKQQFEAAQMASFMALVSIAESLAAITEVLVRADAEIADREGP
jgi:hypothetical protein